MNKTGRHYNINNKSALGMKHTDEYKDMMSKQEKNLQTMRRGFTDENGKRRWLMLGEEIPEGWTPGWPNRDKEWCEEQSKRTKHQWEDEEIREKMIRGLKYGNSRTNYSK